MIMADKNAFVLQDDCSYCGAQEKEEQQELLYECSNCGTLYCDSCGEDKGCPNCGAPFSDSHPIEPLGVRCQQLESESGLILPEKLRDHEHLPQRDVRGRGAFSVSCVKVSGLYRLFSDATAVRSRLGARRTPGLHPTAP